MKKESERLWTTVQGTEHDQMSKCFCILFFFSSFSLKKMVKKLHLLCADEAYLSIVKCTITSICCAFIGMKMCVFPPQK